MSDPEIIYKVTAFIPKGKVLTYAALAKFSGSKNPRIAGKFLHKNKRPKAVPCYRVVNSRGQVAVGYAFGGSKAQIKKLRGEGVEVILNKVNLAKYLWQSSRVLQLYFEVLKKYGEPGAWPWWESEKPHTIEEIAIGAILTQNTAWRNVEYALFNLEAEGIYTIDRIYWVGRKDLKVLKRLIRPAGFYNQKSARLFDFCECITTKYKTLENFLKLPLGQARENLLDLKGIGKETADTILLYAGEKPIFVVDTYTKKFVAKHNLHQNLGYDSLQEFFSKNLPLNAKLYQDYHALIVRWGKEN